MAPLLVVLWYYPFSVIRVTDNLTEMATTEQVQHTLLYCNMALHKKKKKNADYVPFSERDACIVL